MAGSRFVNPYAQSVQSTGLPYPGGQLFFYLSGTSTPSPTYSDSALTTPNTNPVILDSAGSDGNVFLDPTIAAYKVVLEDANGNLIWTADPVYPAAPANVTGTIWGGTSTGSANGQIVSAPGFSQTNGQTVAFIAGFTNTGPLTINAGVGGPLPVYQANSSGPTLLVGGEVVTGNIVTVVYSSVLNGGAGGWQIQSSVFFGSTIINAPINLSLSASVSSNALTINVLGAFGAGPPSPTNPVIIPTRDVTLANGDLTLSTIITPLSMIIPSGATLGANNGVPFRSWIVVFNDGGTARLGVVNCFNGNAQPIFALSGLSQNLNSTTQLTSSSLNAGVIYTNGAAVINKCFAIIGYLEYGAGLTTAGAYNIVPTKLQLVGPGGPFPGQIVQSVSASNLVGQTNISSTIFGVVSNSALPAITLTSAANVVEYSFSAAASVTAVSAVNTSVVAIASRGGAGGGFGAQLTGASPTSAGGTGWAGAFPFEGYDNPPNVGPFTYQLQAKTVGAGSSCNVVNVSGIAKEIMV